jgi:hypothetical protein
MRYAASVVTLAVMAFTGCARKIRTGPLIDSYKAAECIPVSVGPTRGWNYNLQTDERTTVNISGTQLPQGKIYVKYVSTGKRPSPRLQETISTPLMCGSIGRADACTSRQRAWLYRGADIRRGCLNMTSIGSIGRVVRESSPQYCHRSAQRMFHSESWPSGH